MPVLRRFLPALTVLAGCLALCVGATAAASSGPAMHKGQVGRAYLADNATNPGVLCRYDADFASFAGVRVDAPFVFAANTTKGVDHQAVGWRFRIQARPADPGTGPWMPYFLSPVQTATATDQRDAAFHRMSASFSHASGVSDNEYRVQVIMLWYRHGAVAGRVRMTDQWYHGGAFEPALGPNGACPGGIF
jgi:hypothetical protein